MAVNFHVFSRWGDFLGELQVSKATHREVINGEDTLTLTSPRILSKGDRIVWNDGKPHEHVVNGMTRSHGEETEYICDNSFMWDWRLAQVKYAKWTNTALYNVQELCKLTGWHAGYVNETPELEIEHEKISAYEAALNVAGTYGLEIEKVIATSNDGVISRSLQMRKAIGNQTNIRFDYGYGLDGIEQEVLEDDVITACYGYGGSTGRGDSFVSVYVKDDDSLDDWGLPDGKGGKKHAEGKFEDAQINNSHDLQIATEEYLHSHNRPQVRYTADIPLAQLRGVRLGDTIQVVDKTFNPELRLEARIGELERDLISGQTNTCVFGSSRSLLPDIFVRSYKDTMNTIDKVNREMTRMGDVSKELAQLEDRVTALEGGTK